MAKSGPRKTNRYSHEFKATAVRLGDKGDATLICDRARTYGREVKRSVQRFQASCHGIARNPWIT